METETDTDAEKWNVGVNGKKAVKELDSNVSFGGSGGGHRKSTDQTSLQADIQTQILKQLQWVNDRLDLVERKVDSTTDQRQALKGKHPKLSRTVLNNHSSNMTSSDSESSEDDGQVLPSLPIIRSKKSIQKQIDGRIRELEAEKGVEGTETDKIKSKRGGS